MSSSRPVSQSRPFCSAPCEPSFARLPHLKLRLEQLAKGSDSGRFPRQVAGVTQITGHGGTDSG